MKIRTRVFLGILFVVGMGFALLLNWLIDDVSPQYRKVTEEPLVDTARVLASVAAMTVQDGDVEVVLFRTIFDDVYSRSFTAQIYDFLKTSVDFHVYITDALGTVVFDSEFDPATQRGRDEGRDYSRWRDVYRTLKGTYGARSTRAPHDPLSSVMYVAAPIHVQGEVVGVLSVGKPTYNATEFINATKRNIIIAGTLTCLGVIIVGLLVSGMLLRPIQRLTVYAQAVRDGKRVALPALGRSEVQSLGNAFEEMRDALEGKQYVESYVQHLTHEIKSPVAAIQGAAELLQEAMPTEQRDKFLHNILGETQRIQTVIEKLLLLASLENRKAIQEVGTVYLDEIVEEIAESLAPLLAAKEIILKIEYDSSPPFDGERFLIRQAVMNLMQNAVEFTPTGGKMTVWIEPRSMDDGSGRRSVELVVQDDGPGIPDYAQERVFERFYSLPRPDTGVKSSGLGLSLVREVAALHGGSVHLTNAMGSGVIARLIFPLSSDPRVVTL